ncbi:hypothetical protein OC845_004398 [Tilletia horrida]|nr:hypothetical protein OC845_004398 [Tilletia horrida]
MLTSKAPCKTPSTEDLRTRLLVQRASRKDAPSSPFATQAQLPDLSLLGGAKKPTHAAGRHEIGVEEMDQEKTLTNYSADLDTTPSTRKPSQQSAGQSTLVPTQRAASAAGKLVGKLNKHARSASTGDEVDALDFVAVFNRYNRRFYALSKAQRARSPNPASYALASEEDGSTLRRATTTAAASPTSEQPRQLGEQGVKVEVLVRQTSTVPSASQGGFRPMSRLDSAATVTGRKEITLYPSSQPLREQFEDILRRFIGALQDDDGRRESETGNTTLSVEEKDEAHKSTSMSKSTSRTCCPASPRLRWMVDIGLLCEQQISLALAEAEVTTHPQVLAPIADKVAAYLNAHIVPGFLSASTSNLSRTTQLGRLGVGLICLGLAILFTVLLAVNPSPFRPRDASDVSRWWRLLTAPLWCAGVGYVLAAWTGVCVWLTIRGNHEPGQDEGPEDDGPWQSEWEQLSADEHHQPAPSKKKDPTWTLSNPAINAPDPALPWRRPDKKSLMAPELLNILRRFAFLKPLPVAGPEMQQVTSDSLEKGPDFRIEPATSSGILFSNPSWGMPSSTNAHRDSMEERVSPTVSRAASLSGITVAAPGPRQLEPVHEAEKWSPGSSTNIAAVGSTEMSSIGQVASVIDGAIGISVPPPAPPITPRMPSSSGGSFNTPPFSPRSVSPNGGMWRNSSMGSVSVISPTSMSAPAISVRAKKVPVLPVAVGLVKTNVPSPANIHRSPTTSRVSISPFAGGRDEGPARSGAAAASQADAAGMSYAASLYNVATCGPRHSAPRRLASSVWVTIRRATGFAVNTKPVLDSRVRAAQQRAALQSLSICFGITLVILIIIVAVP